MQSGGRDQDGCAVTMQDSASSWGKLSVGSVQDLVRLGCQAGDSRVGNVVAALVLEAEFVGPLPAITRPCASRIISMDRRPPGMSGPTQAGKGEILKPASLLLLHTI